MKRHLSILSAVCAVGMSSSLLWAAPVVTTIVNDTFTDGDRDNDGVQDTVTGGTADTLDIPWFRSGTGVVDIANDTGTGKHGSYALDMTAASNTVVGTLYDVSSFDSQAASTSVTLGTQVGDAIVLTMDFRANNAGGNTLAREFRFGLYDSSTTPISGDEFGTTANDDLGYWVHVPLHVNTETVGIHRDSTVTSGFFDNGELTPTTTASSQASDTGVHTVRLTLERMTTGVTGSVGLSFYFDDMVNPVHSVTDSSLTPYTTFDEIVLWSTASSDPLVDNVLLQTVVVPEPAGLFLLSLGGLLMVGRRRRA